MKNNRITTLLAIGVVVLMSACASKAKTASGPEPARSVEQKPQEAPKEAPPPAAAPAEESAPPPPAVSAEEVSKTAAAEETVAAPAAPEPEPVAPAPEPQPVAATPEPASAEAHTGIDLSTFEIVHFKFDKYGILPEYRDGLAKEAAILKSSGTRIVIQGHCDERGTEEYNMALGDRRANAVKKYWVSLGVDEKQLGAISYGEERPVDPGHNRKAWKLNRRAQFSLAE